MLWIYEPVQLNLVAAEFAGFYSSAHVSVVLQPYGWYFNNFGNAEFSLAIFELLYRFEDTYGRMCEAFLTTNKFPKSYTKPFIDRGNGTCVLPITGDISRMI